MTNDLKKAGMNVKEVLPKEGVTGWSDSWMLSKNAKHPICAYKYMNYVTKPDIQAKVVDVTAYSPANLKTCEVVGAERCKELHIRDENYYNTIKYWKTPVEPDQLQAVDGRLGPGARLITRGISRALYAHPRGRLGLLLGPAVLWLLVFYLVALVLLLMTSLWQQDFFTAEIVRKWTLRNYDKLFTGAGRAVAADLLAHDPARRDRHAGRHRARVPARVVHGARGAAEVAHAPVPRRRRPAVVQHPRADLRLADDPRRPGAC